MQANIGLIILIVYLLEVGLKKIMVKKKSFGIPRLY